MRFIQVQYADIVNARPRSKMEAKLAEFVRMNTKAVEVQWEGSYASSYSAQTSFIQAIKRFDIPAMCIVRKDKVYLIRTDIK